MILTGVLINAAAVAAGGVLGTLGGRLMPEKMKQTVLAATGLVSIVIGISGAIGSSNQLIPILSLVIGSVIGELLHIEDGVTRAGDWLQKRFGKSGSITEGFVTGSLVFAAGAMAVMGALESGLKNDHTILMTKSVLDMAGSVAFAGSLGIGVAFSALSILVLEGTVALLASLLTGVLTDAVITEISVTGSLIIIGVGLNVLSDQAAHYEHDPGAAAAHPSLPLHVKEFTMSFEGYSPAALDFLWGIRFNNERGWFLAHKEDYQSHVLAPTRALGEQVYDAMHEKYPHEPFLLKMSRIYRDARRLHGQGPYKDHLWFCIRAGGEDWTGRPTFYFEVAPDYYSYGMGFWAPKAALMEAYRRRIDLHPQELEKLVRKFNRQTQFVLTGQEYKRKKGETSPLLEPWYNRKSLNFQHELPPDERLFSPELAQDIITGFDGLMPLYKYFDALCAAEAAGEK